jgi:hypothetical protein
LVQLSHLFRQLRIGSLLLRIAAEMTITLTDGLGWGWQLDSGIGKT